MRGSYSSPGCKTEVTNRMDGRAEKGLRETRLKPRGWLISVSMQSVSFGDISEASRLPSRVDLPNLPALSKNSKTTVMAMSPTYLCLYRLLRLYYRNFNLNQ